MFFWKTADKKSIYQILHDIDLNFGIEQKESGCVYCGGRLDWGCYERKPRGGPAGLPEEFSVRFSLCCSRIGCRKRVLPKSVLFDGRRVYWRVIILVVVALREQRCSGFTMRRLQQELGVDAKTVRRWQGWYRERFSAGDWRGVQGHFAGALSSNHETWEMVCCVADSADPQGAMVNLLQFLVAYEHDELGSYCVTQKKGRIRGGEFTCMSSLAVNEADF